jgi:diadenosine tetraphosphate (Ap4A) HIT family hydrolase
MERRSSITSDAETLHPECAFCQFQSVQSYLLKETTHFRIVADHAPLVEGHVLIIPKDHYACYGAVPETLDTELTELKLEVQHFFHYYYAEPVYWEHGVFRQTVFHAHLHCFPFGAIPDIALPDSTIMQSQQDIRDRYQSQGNYFYLENTAHAYLFPPDIDTYMHVIQEVLRPAAAARGAHANWRTAQERLQYGVPLVQSVMQLWHNFQHK